METNNDVKPQATLTVLEKSRELHLLLSKVTLDDNHLQKVFQATIGRAVTDHSQKVYELLAVANTIDLFDQELNHKRKEFQMEARYEITRLLAALRIMYSITEMSADKMQVLLQKTIEVERLLKKWIESDKNRIGSALHIIKKDEIDTHLFDKNSVSARDLFNPRPHINFDRLLKDVRQTPPAVRDGKQMFVPPASTLDTAYIPPAVKVVQSEAERIASIASSRKEIDLPPEVGQAPVPKTRADYAIPTREPIKVVVRDQPIIVPDNRIKPPPPPSDPEILPATVSIASSVTPESLTEDLTITPVQKTGGFNLTETKENEPCHDQPSVPSDAAPKDSSTAQPEPAATSVLPTVSESNSTPTVEAPSVTESPAAEKDSVSSTATSVTTSKE